MTFANISSDIYDLNGRTKYNESVYAPVMQYGSQALDSSLSLLDLHTHPVFRRMIDDTTSARRGLFSEPVDLAFLLKHIEELAERDEDEDDRRRRRGLQDNHDNDEATSTVNATGDPEDATHHEENNSESDPHLQSFFLQPIYENFEVDGAVVGHVVSLITWESLFRE